MYLIKVLGLVCALLVMAQTKEIGQDEKDMIMAITQECRETHKVNDESMNKMMAGNIPETQSEKCGATCVMQQFKVVVQNGKFLELDCKTFVGMAETKGLDEKAKTLISEVCEKCKAPATPDNCELSAMVGTCLKKELEKRGLSMNSF